MTENKKKRSRSGSITELESALKRACKAENDCIKQDCEDGGPLHISEEQLDAKIRISVLLGYLKEVEKTSDNMLHYRAASVSKWYSTQTLTDLLIADGVSLVK